MHAPGKLKPQLSAKTSSYRAAPDFSSPGSPRGSGEIDFGMQGLVFGLA